MYFSCPRVRVSSACVVWLYSSCRVRCVVFVCRGCFLVVYARPVNYERVCGPCIVYVCGMAQGFFRRKQKAQPKNATTRLRNFRGPVYFGVLASLGSWAKAFTVYSLARGPVDTPRPGAKRNFVFLVKAFFLCTCSMCFCAFVCSWISILLCSAGFRVFLCSSYALKH